MRGLIYIEHHVFIDDSYEFGVSFTEDDAASFFVDTSRNGGFVVHRGPGISITRAYLPTDARTGIFAIELWQRCRVYAIVAKKEAV